MKKAYFIGKLRTEMTTITTRNTTSSKNINGKFIHGLSRKYPQVLSTKTIPNDKQ